MRRSCDILLVFPPAFYPHMPYLGLAAVSAALRKGEKGHRKVDLNVMLYDHLLRESVVEGAWRKVRMLADKGRVTEDYRRRTELTGHPAMSAVIRMLPTAKAAVRSRLSGISPSIDPWRVLTLGLDIVSDAHFPEQITFTKYEPAVSSKSSRRIADYLPCRHSSLYHGPSFAVLRDRISAEKPGIVGFSITASDQIVPAAGLSASLKEEFPEIKVLWGGSVVTRLASVFARPNALSGIYDAVVLGEGDHDICETVDQVRASELSSVSGQPIVFQAKPSSCRLDRLAAPDFDDLPLDLYFDKELVLPLLASRRCYWGKCLFCDIPASYAPTHREREPSLVVDDMELLARRYGARQIKFADDAVSPAMLRGISAELLRRSLDLRWEAYVRLEPEFADVDFCDMLFAAGCRWLYFGLESASIPTLSKMQKGNTPALSSRILRTASAAGLKTHVWVVVGFPSETRDDVERTIDFVLEHGPFLHSIEVNQFALSRLAPAMTDGVIRELGITPHVNPEQDLALLYDYDVTEGLSQEEAHALTLEVREIFRREIGVPNVVRSSHLSEQDDKDPGVVARTHTELPDLASARTGV